MAAIETRLWPWRKEQKALRARLRLWLDSCQQLIDFARVSPGRRRDFPACATAMSRSRLHIFYSGRVQGVGFRYTVKSLAMGFEVTGTVRNLADGRVELVSEGTREELDAFQRAVQDSEVGRFIRQEEVNWRDATGEFRGFEIIG